MPRDFYLQFVYTLGGSQYIQCEKDKQGCGHSPVCQQESRVHRPLGPCASSRTAGMARPHRHRRVNGEGGVLMLDAFRSALHLHPVQHSMSMVGHGPSGRCRTTSASRRRTSSITMSVPATPAADASTGMTSLDDMLAGPAPYSSVLHVS